MTKQELIESIHELAQDYRANACQCPLTAAVSRLQRTSAPATTASEK